MNLNTLAISSNLYFLRRSRSGTPSSYPGTPPQSLHSSDLIGNSQNSSSTNSRRYTQMIQCLAAKYKNKNQNELSHSRNALFDTRNTGMNTKESPSPPDSKRLQPTLQSVCTTESIQVPAQNSLISAIFPTGVAFPQPVFSPLIDMSSTQALLTLARAAKEAEIQNLLKGPTKRPHISTTSPSSINQIATTTTLSNSRFPLQPFSISNLSQPNSSHISPKSPASNMHSLGNEQATLATSPLDLSAAPTMGKRMKMDALSPNQSIGSPTHQRSQRKCQSQSDEINSWNVGQVCEFVGSIDICAEYVEKRFEPQRAFGRIYGRKKVQKRGRICKDNW
ncbi:hypothetical protein Bhyg_04007 [Pseudolycoriella hygida]|uniref:Uncharacterized protein n=1 Tax=Pseudolycoriella hygida TaxID=35572 RepID=A0A9Q0NEB6_9DIPT|nr:hypothetical protein Bhyg_04007 [Pseudolycoriella hygida]